MQGMCLAKSAVLLGFHAVRMGLLILRHVVIPLLAFCTCQCNSRTHNFHLHSNFVKLRPFFEHKKKT